MLKANLNLNLQRFSSTDYAYDNIESDRIVELFTKMKNDIISRIDKYSKEGSGWILCRILYFKLNLFRFNITSGGDGKIILPPVLLSKHCIINIETKNCFKWAILSAMHHKDVNNPSSITQYSQWEKDYEFPQTQEVTANQVAAFVKKNKLPIFTHHFDADKLYVECTYCPPRSMIISNPVHLLLYKNHWMAITKLSCLYRKHKGGIFEMCTHCLATFYNKDRFEKHLPCIPRSYIHAKLCQQNH